MHMEKSEEFYGDICELKQQLLRLMRSATATGLDSVDTKEAGEVIDMIKDLAETEKYCREAHYYKTVVEAMDDGKSSMLYRPYVDQEPYVNEHLSKYGRTYNDYEHLKKYYTETKSLDKKMEMEAKASEYVGETLMTIRGIWRDADPEMRKKLKEDFSRLVSEMNV